MALITPYQRYLELQRYVQEFQQKTIRVIEVQTDDQYLGELDAIENGLPIAEYTGVQLFPQSVGVEIIKINKIVRRAITGKLKMIFLDYKKKYTFQFLYLRDYEKNEMERNIFRKEEMLHLTFFDYEETSALEESDPLFSRKIQVKMTNDLKYDVKPISTGYVGGEISAFGDKTWKGMAVYQGVTVVLEEI